MIKRRPPSSPTGEYFASNDAHRSKERRSYLSMIGEPDVSRLHQDTMKIYIDGMIMKSLKERDHLDHLKQTFEVLRKYNMKLNSGSARSH